MIPLDVTWQRSLRVFWLILWRGIVGAMLLGMVIGFAIGLAGAVLGWPRNQVVQASTGVGVLISTAWTAAVVRMALRKRYRGFRIVLVAT